MNNEYVLKGIVNSNLDFMNKNHTLTYDPEKLYKILLSKYIDKKDVDLKKLMREKKLSYKQQQIILKQKEYYKIILDQYEDILWLIDDWLVRNRKY